MFIVTFIIAAVFIMAAAIIFSSGLVSLHHGSERARGLISSGFMVGILGVVIAAITFGFFSV